MQSSQDSLIHQATSIFRLVDSIDRLVAEHESEYSYTEAAQALFLHVHGLAKETRRSTSDLIEMAGRTSEPNPRYRRELMIRKDRWRILHTYIKPATDAHSLSLPAPLVELATESLRCIPGFQQAEIVILLTPELMYFHNTSQSDLPENMVFVEVPYSLGPGFFTNLMIYHELGHYVYDKLKDDEEHRTPAFKALISAMEQAYADKLSQRLDTPRNRTFAKRVLESWTTEIFCDLFALRILGPAFAFALIDFLLLLGLMGEDVEGKFDDEHPAPALRFREQQKCLQTNGWWDLVAKQPSEHIALIARLAEKSESDYVFEFQDAALPGLFVDAFQTILPVVHELATEVVLDAKAAADFAQHDQPIRKCLLHGVVPSSLLTEDSPASPTPVSIINAAYCFHLTDQAVLMDRLAGQRVDDVARRVIWTEKLEAWTLKAIEDSQLLVSAAKVRRDGK